MSSYYKVSSASTSYSHPPKTSLFIPNRLTIPPQNTIALVSLDQIFGMLDASKFKPGHIDLNGDILGPGIVIGYLALLAATLLIVMKPSAFEGIPNGMACVTMAMAYAISSTVQTARTSHPPNGQEVENLDQGNLGFSLIMAAFALILAELSLLSRGVKVEKIQTPLAHGQNGFIGTTNVFRRRVHLAYMSSFFVGMIVCFVLGVVDTVVLAKTPGTDQTKSLGSFARWNYGLLVIHALFFVYAAFATAFAWGIHRRKMNIIVCAAFTAPLWLFIFWSIGSKNVSSRFDDWSYGQTFGGAAGCVGLLSTIASWLAQEGYD